MRRTLAICGALLCALTLIPSAGASGPQAPPLQARGTVTAVGDSWFTLQTSGRRVGVINALIASANAIAAAGYPYVWGGGHERAGVPSVGIPGHGYNGRRRGFDCSGAVAAVLAGAGLWAPGSGVPGDAGVIKQLLQQGLIAPGPGRAPASVTLYDNPGVHIFMSINGRFFGTSNSVGTGSRRGGAGWIPNGAEEAADPADRPYHVLPSVLRDRTTYGHSLTFAGDSALISSLRVGDRLSVSYANSATGSLVLRALSPLGASTLRATVLAASREAGTLTLQPAGGAALTLSAPDGALLDGLGAGDLVTVAYTRSGQALVLRSLTLLAPARPQEAIGTVTALTDSPSALTITTADGGQLSLVSPGGLSGIATGDAVDVRYVAVNGTLVVRSISAA